MTTMLEYTQTTYVVTEQQMDKHAIDLHVCVYFFDIFNIFYAHVG